MKFGGMQKKKFIKDFIKKAQEGMEQTDQSVIGNNDIQDGRASLVKGFESGVKSAVVKAVAKNQFDKMKQQMSYFQDGGFYDPNNSGDEEAYAHHLNLMAAANKDIFNQPELTMARDGREQRRAAREQRRVGRDVQRILNNLPYILKHKGTGRAMKAIMACYGVPQSMLTIMEFGGRSDERV
jgi:predicted ATPase